jgi:Protein of unknown function (DUF642)/PEP-CTERM motif
MGGGAKWRAALLAYILTTRYFLNCGENIDRHGETMRTRLRIFATAFIAVMAVSPGANATVNLLVNGGFEDPSNGGVWYLNYGTETNPANYVGPSFSGWTVTTNNVDIVEQGVSGPSAAFEGSQYLDLVGYGSTGGIEQSFSTVAGRTYDLTFAYSNNPWSTTTASASVMGAGGHVDLTDVVTHDTSTISNLDWVVYNGAFTADSSLTTLAFLTTVGSGSGGVMLDAVSVSSAVPEPSTWAMMLLGFGGIGFAGYRRTKVRSLNLAAA